MTKLGIGRILEKRAGRETPKPILEADVAAKIEPTPAPAPKPVPPPFVEAFVRAQAEQKAVVEKLKETRRGLAGNEKALAGLVGTIARAIDRDARRGGGYYTEDSRLADQKRLAALTLAIVEGRQAIKTLENTEGETGKALRKAETVLLLSQVGDHERTCGAIQEEIIQWRNKGIELSAAAKVEFAAAVGTGEKYVAICKQAGDFWEPHAFAPLPAQWQLALAVVRGQS